MIDKLISGCIFLVSKKSRWRHCQSHKWLERIENHRPVDNSKSSSYNLGSSFCRLSYHQSFEGTTKGSQEGEEHQTLWKLVVRWHPRHCQADETEIHVKETWRNCQRDPWNLPFRWMYRRGKATTWFDRRHQEWRPWSSRRVDGRFRACFLRSRTLRMITVCFEYNFIPMFENCKSFKEFLILIMGNMKFVLLNVRIKALGRGWHPIHLIEIARCNFDRHLIATGTSSSDIRSLFWLFC